MILCFISLALPFHPLSGSAPIIAFNKNGLLIEFTCEKDNSQASVIIVNVKATNSSPTPMTEFVFQAAVPKVNGGL